MTNKNENRREILREKVKFEKNSKIEGKSETGECIMASGGMDAPAYSHNQWRIQGSKSGHAPPSKLSMEFAPSGAERVMTALWNCRKVRNVAPPRIDVGSGFGSPIRKKDQIKTLKRSMTKKRSGEILGDRRQFL